MWSLVLSKLAFLALKVPNEYDKSQIQQIVQAICQQVDLGHEGKISARYQAQSVVPGTSVAAQVGDVQWNLNPTVVNGTITGALVGNYIVEKWICTVADPVNPTWKEVRVLTP